MTTDFNSYDWDTLVYTEQNLDTAVNNLNDTLVELCDKHAPLEKVSNRKKKYCTKPYIDKELVQEIKTKNKLYSLYRRHPSEHNKVSFKTAKNKVVANLREKKKAFFITISKNLEIIRKKCGKALI